MPTVREAVVSLLRELGMTTIFGNPGSTELPLFRDFPDDFRYVLGLQESVVVGMADGYAQATGNAAIVNLHSAAGVGHAMGNIFTAYRNRTPLVITAGQQARSILPYEPFLFASAGGEAARAVREVEQRAGARRRRAAAIARAYYIAMQAPCGPTFVSIPVDDWDRHGRASSPRAPSAARSHPDPASARARLRDAARSQRAAGVRRRPRRRSRTARGTRSWRWPSGIRRWSGSARCRRAAAFRSGIRCLPGSCRRSASRSSSAWTATI